MLKRKIYGQLEKWKSDKRGTCLMIRGPRQVGKTYAVDHFGKENYENYLYVNFELQPEVKEAFSGNLDVETVTKKLTAYFPDFIFEEGNTLIFFDEIQMCPEARTSLKSFATDGRYDVIATGSLLGIIFKQTTGTPMGYETQVDMHPLDFEEFLWANGYREEFTEDLKESISKKKPLGSAILSTMNEKFREHMIVGGMPKAVDRFVKENSFGAAQAALRDISDMQRTDVIRYSSQPDKVKTLACLESVPAQLTNTNKKFTYANINGDGSAPSRKYEGNLLWLHDAGIISYCHNITEPKIPLASKKITDSFKIYMRDTGLLTLSYGDSARIALAIGKGGENKASANEGAITENAVADMLYKNNIPLYYYKKGGKEVDFVTELGLDTALIEVKSGSYGRFPSLDYVAEKYGADRRIVLGYHDIGVDTEGREYYPLFAAAFIKSMTDEKYAGL